MPKVFILVTYSPEKHAKQVHLNISNVESEHQNKLLNYVHSIPS